MTDISFKTTPAEFDAISGIVDRACAMWPEFDRMTLVMDLTATNANGCPLDLDKLAKFPNFDFAHDVFGISNHIDRKTGKLTRCFLPRCAKGDDQ